MKWCIVSKEHTKSHVGSRKSLQCVGRMSCSSHYMQKDGNHGDSETPIEFYIGSFHCIISSIKKHWWETLKAILEVFSILSESYGKALEDFQQRLWSNSCSKKSLKVVRFCRNMLFVSYLSSNLYVLHFCLPCVIQNHQWK